MRVLLFLGALLVTAPAFAFNDSVVTYCASTAQPKHCISTFLEYEKYYALDYVNFLSLVDKDPMTAPPYKPGELINAFCSPPLIKGTTEHCQSTFAAFTPYATGFLQWAEPRSKQQDNFAQQHEMQQRQIDAQLLMQQRMIDAQLEQARIQANGMALFGSGPALINGMNQGFQNMQRPISPPPAFVPMQLNPVQSPIRCYSSNPGPMQSTVCY